jgi:hypothetical protein
VTTIKSSNLTSSKLDSNIDYYADDYPIFSNHITISNYGKDVYMLSKGLLYRFSQFSWDEYLDKLKEDSNYFLAIFIILQMCEGNYNKLWGISAKSDEMMIKMRETV